MTRDPLTAGKGAWNKSLGHIPMNAETSKRSEEYKKTLKWRGKSLCKDWQWEKTPASLDIQELWPVSLGAQAHWGEWDAFLAAQRVLTVMCYHAGCSILETDEVVSHWHYTDVWTSCITNHSDTIAPCIFLFCKLSWHRLQKFSFLYSGRF